MPEEHPVVSPPSERPSRADAARNHHLVLSAACEIFAKAGPEAQIEDVARRAGVGIGTVYRRFGTKDALLAAVLDVGRTQLGEQAAAARRAADPMAGIADLVRSVATSAAADRALLTTFVPGAAQHPPDAGDEDRHDPMAAASVTAALAELLDRARDRGQVRRDVTVDDLAPLVTGLVLAAAPPSDSERWERSLRIVLDGITAPGAGEPA